MLLYCTNAKHKSGLRHTPKMVSIGLCLLVIVGCASPSRPVATPTFQVDHGTPTTKPMLTTVPQFWTDSDFTCWTAPAARLAVNDATGSDRLLVATGEWDNDLTVYRFDFVTSQYTRLFEGVLAPGHSKPLPISPDGQHLWYGIRERAPLDSHYPYTDTIHVYNLLDRSTRQVPFPVDDKRRLMAPDDAIGWSPDSKCLIWWLGNTAIAYRLADGAMQSKVFPGTLFGWEVSPAPTGRLWIWKAGLDIDFMRLMPDASKSIEPGKFKVDDNPYYRSAIFRWSNDGRTVAIVYSTKDTPYGTDRIRLVHFTDDEVDAYQDIPSSAFNIQWSPNSRYLLIDAGDKGYRLFDRVTETVTEISSRHGHSYNAMPVWSPSSEQIAFVAGDERSLYVVNTDGRGERPLPAPPSGNSIFFIIWIR